MTGLVNIKSRSDIIGATASTLCFVHCLATPFLFVAQAGLAVGEELHPWWWGTLDIVFLVISFLAVYWSAKHSSKRWMKYALWLSWIALTFIVLNEKAALIELREEAIYVPALGLIFFHLYNRKYCTCGKEQCCVDEKMNA